MATPTKAPARRGRARAGSSPSAQDAVETPAAPAAPAAQLAPTSQPRTAGHPRAAAAKTTRHNSAQVRLPVLGPVKLPPADELAYLGGVGVLAVVGVLEWPVAAVLGAGHLLATNRRNKVLQEFGEALETR